MRVVVDTNTLISAFLFPASVPGQCIHDQPAKFELLASEQTRDEFLRVLRYPKFDKYISDLIRLQAEEYFLEGLILVDIISKIQDCRDPHDNKFLELAIDGKADLIITGDKDLLTLHPYKNIPIITPKEFLEIISTKLK